MSNFLLRTYYKVPFLRFENPFKIDEDNYQYEINYTVEFSSCFDFYSSSYLYLYGGKPQIYELNIQDIEKGLSINYESNKIKIEFQWTNNIIISCAFYHDIEEPNDEDVMKNTNSSKNIPYFEYFKDYIIFDNLSIETKYNLKCIFSYSTKINKGDYFIIAKKIYKYFLMKR